VAVARFDSAISSDRLDEAVHHHRREHLERLIEQQDRGEEGQGVE